MHYLDSSNVERARQMSIKAKPLSLVLPTLNGKSYMLNLIDTPGASPTVLWKLVPRGWP